MVTGGEFEVVWSVLGKVGVAIALVVGIIQGFKYLFSLMPVSKLELRVDSNEGAIKNNTEHLKKIDNKIEKMEDKIEETVLDIKMVDEGIKRIGESQISLLHHFVNGNGQKDMEDEAEKLTDFFIRRDNYGK